jgi:carbamoylphosphate synthase small subunit
MRVGIFSNTNLSREEMVVKVRKTAPMEGAFLAADVSTKQTYVVKPPNGTPTKFKVAAIDLGIKGATPKYMARLGIEVHVMPMNSTFADVKAISPDGVFLSNGPVRSGSNDRCYFTCEKCFNRGYSIFWYLLWTSNFGASIRTFEYLQVAIWSQRDKSTSCRF